MPCTTKNQLTLQIVYEFPSTISAVLDQVCTTDHGNNLRIVHGYFNRWIRHLMTCSQKKFALFLYLSKGIFKGCFASFAKDFNIWRYHLLPPLRKNFSLYLPIWKRNFAYKIGITPTHIKVTLKAFWWGDIANIPHLIATRMAFWGGTFSKIQSMFTNSLSPNSLEKKQNLRLQRKYPHLLP